MTTKTSVMAEMAKMAKMAEMAKTGLGRANSDNLLALLKNKGSGSSDFYVFFPEQQLNLLVF